MKEAAAFILMVGFVAGMAVTSTYHYYFGTFPNQKRDQLKTACELNLPRSEKCILTFVPEKR